MALDFDFVSASLGGAGYSYHYDERDYWKKPNHFHEHRRSNRPGKGSRSLVCFYVSLEADFMQQNDNIKNPYPSAPCATLLR